ncbi:S-adenosyl-L-methionine-dependent methyltransferases superfamily protein [Quillaja saponaria]|uniref:Methyltransferase n=1 Tax=Quillaja saponaria TaxID=32244 RepID=A0AAD7LUK6_QUISA|nr:S-adenosyl-L-methionine-dependent methyltransferases superfamily protein [Quillaja saponaria]
MKPFVNGDLLKTSLILKISAVFVISVTFFYLGKNWSDGYQQLIFFSNTRQNPVVSMSPNYNKGFNVPSLINQNQTEAIPEKPLSLPSVPRSSPPPLQPPSVKTFGIVNENGTMSGEFEIGEFNPESMSEFIPCLDNEEAIRKLKSTEKGERFERHCPEEGRGLNCLVPSPKGYRTPIPWPRSRDEVWFSNVPHTRLTTFLRCSPEIAFGQHTRVVLDVGCGVASFGAYLLSRNVITMSVAPKDVHENQIQFALERGVPAMVAAFATRRLLYPSQAFDLIHCSRCRINWTRDDGIVLLEVNRMLRAGGYFVWAAQPVYKHEEILEEQWEEMLNLTTRLCWKFVKKDGYIAIWQKPFDNSCYLNRESGTKPLLCDPTDDPDNVWYADLKACISRLPENGYGANVTTWPARLQTPPDRLQSIQMDAYISRKELFKAESKYWNEIIESYVRALHWKKIRLRNVMDMRAGFGGFAAALIDQKLDSWVMNVVPISGPNTLPVIYDRGLMGVVHDWCEPFDTYPRTYDLLHAAGLLSVERKRCNISSIMLEMDRILRPGGRVYIRDSLSIMDELQEIAKEMGWHVTLQDTSEGPHVSYRIFVGDKRLLRA